MCEYCTDAAAHDIVTRQLPLVTSRGLIAVVHGARQEFEHRKAGRLPPPPSCAPGMTGKKATVTVTLLRTQRDEKGVEMASVRVGSTADVVILPLSELVMGEAKPMPTEFQAEAPQTGRLRCSQCPDLSWDLSHRDEAEAHSNTYRHPIYVDLPEEPPKNGPEGAA